jgi:hypothetical protein
MGREVIVEPRLHSPLATRHFSRFKFDSLSPAHAALRSPLSSLLPQLHIRPSLLTTKRYRAGVQPFLPPSSLKSQPSSFHSSLPPQRRTKNKERRTKNFFNAPPALPLQLSGFKSQLSPFSSASAFRPRPSTSSFRFHASGFTLQVCFPSYTFDHPF